MSLHPTTCRLVLRTPMLADQSDVVRLLNDYVVVKNLAPMPCPYTEGEFREFLARYEAEQRAGTEQHFAVTRAMDGAFIGMCYLSRSQEGVWALGCWSGRPYWGKGYATETARGAVRFAFEDLGAQKLTSGWCVDNAASENLLRKFGFVDARTVQRYCVSRGLAVTSNRMLLTPDQFARKKAA